MRLVMAVGIKNHVIATLRSVMKPIIMLLLRNGVTYKEFILVCKSLFVEAAAEDYGIRGRPTNVSRIALLTGIDRKEVKRIKDLLKDNLTAIEAQQHQDRITRVLSAWHQDLAFVDAQGKPKTLPLQGAESSFSALVRRYAGDVPLQALLKELQRLELIESTDQGLRALSRHYIPTQSDPQALLRAGSVLAELSETLFHNLYVADAERPGTKKMVRFERRASNNRIHTRHKKAFYSKLEQEGQEFLERMDAWLSEHELEAEPEGDAASPPSVRLSVSLFGCDKPIDNTDP